MAGPWASKGGTDSPTTHEPPAWPALGQQSGMGRRDEEEEEETQVSSWGDQALHGR